MGTQVFSRPDEHLVVSVDDAHLYVEANCDDPVMDRYLFVHFTTSDGRFVNSDLGFDANAARVSDGPPLRCRATVPFPASASTIELGQQESGAYVWNITYDIAAKALK